MPAAAPQPFCSSSSLRSAKVARRMRSSVRCAARAFSSTWTGSSPGRFSIHFNLEASARHAQTELLRCGSRPFLNHNAHRSHCGTLGAVQAASQFIMKHATHTHTSPHALKTPRPRVNVVARAPSDSGLSKCMWEPSPGRPRPSPPGSRARACAQRPPARSPHPAPAAAPPHGCNQTIRHDEFVIRTTLLFSIVHPPCVGRIQPLQLLHTATAFQVSL